MARLVFYSDVLEWGGHERMACMLANMLSDSHDVIFLYRNERFVSELGSKVQAFHIPCRTRTPFPFAREPFALRDILWLHKRLKELDPDLFIVAQGTIELCAKALIVSKLAGIGTVSYLPLAFSFFEMAGRKIDHLRDWVNRLIYYKLPNAFIVPALIQKEALGQHAVSAPVYVIPNPLSTDWTCEKIRRELITDQTFRIGVIGRLVKHQKNLDILPSIAKYLADLAGGHKFEFIMVGDGDYRSSLESQIKQQGLAHHFRFIGWLDMADVSQLLSSEVELVLITSRYETSPSLVLLEAIGHGVPVICSDIPAFEAYIPPEWRFDVNSPEKAAKVIESYMKEPGKYPLEFMREDIMHRHSIVAFRKATEVTFNTLLGCLPNARG